MLDIDDGETPVPEDSLVVDLDESVAIGPAVPDLIQHAFHDRDSICEIPAARQNCGDSTHAVTTSPLFWKSGGASLQSVLCFVYQKESLEMLQFSCFFLMLLSQPPNGQ